MFFSLSVTHFDTPPTHPSSSSRHPPLLDDYGIHTLDPSGSTAASAVATKVYMGWGSFPVAPLNTTMSHTKQRCRSPRNGSLAAIPCLYTYGSKGEMQNDLGCGSACSSYDQHGHNAPEISTETCRKKEMFLPLMSL